MRKQRNTVPIWAQKITVRETPEALIVSGQRRILWPASDIGVDSDLLKSSKPLGQDDQGRKMPPHVNFANASTDAKLVEFVKKWGPVDGISKVLIGKSLSDKVLDLVATQKRTKRLYVSFTVPQVEFEVRQDIKELRREQKLFSAAARLIAEIQKEKPFAERVFEYYSQLPESEDRELFFRVVENRRRGRSLARAACERAQGALCQLLDKFPARLHLTKGGPVELPPLDAQFIGRGIRSVLYFFLRLEYLNVGRCGLGVCQHCNEVFAIDRQGAVYCNERCSAQHRSLEYYREHGRARRREQAATSRSSSPLDTDSAKRRNR